MKILDKIVKTATTKILVNTAVDAGIKTANAVKDYKNNSPSIQKIAIPNSSEYYQRKNYKAVQEELAAYGFTNITIFAQRDLVNGWLTKDGAVEEVSINGKTDFKKKAKFHQDVNIVIKYHTFRNK